MALAQSTPANTIIENTAFVTYEGGTLEAVATNTVTITIGTTPTPAVIDFFTYTDTGSPGSVTMPVDGGECRNDQGVFGPLPLFPGQSGGAVTGAANPLAQAASAAETYVPGEPIVVRLEDHNRNKDPAVREYVEVTITTTEGDEEVLRLQETGVDTGVFATAVPSAGVPPAPSRFDCQLSVVADEILTATYVDPDFPGDTTKTTAVIEDPRERRVMVLDKRASVPVAEAGDFLQYQLSVSNPGDRTLSGVWIEDQLPPGMRYQPGSLRVGDEALEPEVGPDGRTLTIAIGTLDPAGKVAVRYVVAVGAGAEPGELVNRAIARGNRSVVSNVAEATVLIRDALFTGRFTIVGEVVEGACELPAEALAGVPNVRLLLDDGTFVTTDEQGRYHFEGVRPGTHVVQVDVATLPSHLEAMPCGQDTRFAGRGFSQFVEAGGGALMRADFRLQAKGAKEGEVGTRLTVSGSAGTLETTLSIDVGAVPVEGLRAMLMLPPGVSYVAGSTRLDGADHADPEVTGSLLSFDLGNRGAGWQGSLVLRATGSECPATAPVLKAVALFRGGGEQRRTPPVEVEATCANPTAQVDSGRHPFTFVHTPAAEEAASSSEEDTGVRLPTAERDWLTGQAPGNEWLLPAEGDAPRGKSQPVVIKHLPGHRVVLKNNGKAVSGIHFNGTRTNVDKTVAVTLWRGVPLEDGDNELVAEIVDADGVTVATLPRSLRYSIEVARAELVPEKSRLVADALHGPVIAVRMLDSTGRPVRSGVGGDYAVSAPYLPAQSARMQQERQLAGMEAFEPTWEVRGNDGIALIELQPTGTSGEATLSFEFRLGEQATRKQALSVWLKPEVRDWVVVGFAAGTVGYDTLHGNMEALSDRGDEAGLQTDGQLSLYAKGRVLGNWMLTLAYDSDKPSDRLRREGLLSTIDPNRFYTLYGDGATQGYDASSAEKVYLKLERDQFYAMFGDFTTGLGDGELTRYHRAFNGLKVEYHGPVLEANGFAAKTAQRFARDEIQGDGTSGLYRLSRGSIVTNGERVRIETRDRFRSEIVVESRELVRHLDYDIDYDAGTLFFREPIPSRDFAFNPVFIVVEYETFGGGDEYLNAGGRIGVRLLDDRLHAGLTYIREENDFGNGELGGIDVSYAFSPQTRMRAEAAASRGETGAVERSGNAYVVEVEHHGEAFDVLAYVREQEGGFGLGQQNAAETGTFKAGVDAQWRIGDNFALQGRVNHQEQLATGVTRNALNVEGEYQSRDWGARAGLQWVRDQARDGRVAESRQMTVGANRRVLGGQLDLSIDAAFSLGGKNDSVDFPTRVTLGASYAINNAFRVIVAQEFTDGEDRDTSTTRFGFEAEPWAGATLSSTLNQARISEYGPRTFGLFGLKQKFLIGERWSLDVSADTSRSFNESGHGSLVVNPDHPIASGGIRDGGALTEDFFALSGGVTYRDELWTWNARVENRDGRQDRQGFASSFLRQATDGVAFLASAQAFNTDNPDGSRGLLANATLSWAYRPLGSRWSLLDRLEFRLDELRRGNGVPVAGNDSLAVVGDARSRRLVNNLVLNYVGDPWTREDRRGNLFDAVQRSQLSLYYGSKYVFDTYDGEDYAGYTDIFGVEWRYDLSHRFDLGLRASVRHSWDEGAFSYAFGPSIGFTPFTNAWFSVGYNVIGFDDRDFQAMHYTAQGPYLMLRFKFDQKTLGLASDDPGHAR